MRRLRRTTLAVLVWLLTVTVTVDGFPRIQCRCPDGQIQTSFLGLVKSARPCCRANNGEPTTGTSCCCRSHRAPTTICTSCGQSESTGHAMPGQAQTIQAAGCVKSLHSSDHVAIQADDAVTYSSLCPIASVPMPFPIQHPHVAGTEYAFSGQTHPLAVPTDLITVLQRLVL